MHCPIQRLEGEIAGPVVGGGPGDDPAAVDVDYDHRVEPSLSGADLGGVDTPQLIGPVSLEPSLHQVRDFGSTSRGSRPWSLLLDSPTCSDPVDLHQPGHPILPDRMASTAQHPANTWRSVGGKLGVDRPDLCEECRVGLSPSRRRVQRLAPGIEPGTRYPQHPTCSGDVEGGIGCLLRFDPGVDQPWSPRRTKKAKAFPKVSSSSSRWARRRFNRAISSLSDRASWTGSMPLARRARRVQFVTVVGDNPNSDASCFAETPSR